MFEGLVKRLLDTYLAPYVDGITQNLQMAVWSGNISLENLTLKDDITSRLALPFHDVAGKIGSINIRIPWATLGTTPIKIVVDSMYICIDNRSNLKTDEEILAHLRKKKDNLISLLEHEYFELANLNADSKLSSSYIIKLSQKILNNIQINFTNIHLQFFDEHSSFAFKIDSIFVRKSRAGDGKMCLRIKTNDEFREEPVTHVCSLLGFSICETTFNINKQEFNSKLILDMITGHLPDGDNAPDSQYSTGLPMLEPLSFRLYLAVNPKNKSIYASLSIGSFSSDPGIHSNAANNKNRTKGKTGKQNDENDPNNESSEDMIKVVLTSDVIRTFTKMWVDIKMDRKRGKRMLESSADDVRLDPMSLKSTTKPEFIKLYTKYKLANTDPTIQMDDEERKRLQYIIDIVPARYIARWKFACKRRSSAKVMTQENRSWFKWAKNVVTTTYANYQSSRSSAEEPVIKQDSASKAPRRFFRPSFLTNLNNTQPPKQGDSYRDAAEVAPEPETSDPPEPIDQPNDVTNQIAIENLPGGLVLTEDEIKMIQETITLEELFEDSFTTSSYYFECVLPSFQFVIQLLGQPESTHNNVVFDVQNLQSRLFMHAVMDMKDRDRYEGYFDLNLDSFDVVVKDRKVVTFSQQSMPFQSIVDTYIEPEGVVTYSQGAAGDLSTTSPQALPLTHSVTVAEKCIMNLRIYHKITDRGNVVSVNGELRPIETNVFPDHIAILFELISLFKPIQIILHEDSVVETRGSGTLQTTASIESGTSGTREDDVEDEELLGSGRDLDSERDLVRSGSTEGDKINFINFDIKFSAPILLLYYEANRIDFFFGTLHVKSNGDCPLDHIDGTLELKQTQVTCNYMDKSFNFLRPLPVKIHYDLDVNNEQINLNVIFEELFAQVEPLATSILFKVPNEIVKVVLKHMTEAPQTQSPESIGSDQAHLNPLANKAERLKQFKIVSNVLIRHSGFSVSNLDMHEIFKLDMYNVSAKATKEVNKQHMSLSLESIIISNPSTKIPLFKTINSSTGVYTDPMDQNLDVGDLNIVQYSGVAGDEADRSVDFAPESDLEDEFVDAVEDVSKSLDIELITDTRDGAMFKFASVQVIEMEGNWEYSTINQIVNGFHEYNEVFNAQMEDTDFTTITNTLKTFKDKFMFNPNLAKQGTLTQNRLDTMKAPDETEPSETPIEKMMVKGSLPLLEAEEKQLDVTTKYKVMIRGASVVFNNASGEIIAKLALGRMLYKMTKFQTDEMIVRMSVETGKLYFGGRCILSHLLSNDPCSDLEHEAPQCANPENPSEQHTSTLCQTALGIVQSDPQPSLRRRPSQSTDHSDNLLDLKLKCYNSEDVPYSMCFQGKVDRIVFVYFQHDINRLLEYFDDGILSVFISKSYHKVVQRAEQMYMFYQFSITSPIFILPENKAAIPNCTTHYKQTIPPGSTLPLYVHETLKRNDPVNIADSTDSETGQLSRIARAVDLWYFGSYVLFELGHLELKNTYSKLVDTYKSTVILKMLGTRAQIFEQKDGSTDVQGVFLDPTDLKVCTRGRDVVEMGIDSRALVMKLTRNQLTFLIDVFNENLGGATYKIKTAGTTTFTQNFPTKNESRYLIRLSLNKFQMYCYNNATAPKREASNEKSANRRASPIPVGVFEFKDITCCLDYASNNVELLSYYQFGFISRSVTVTDLRVNSFNEFKTLLRCNSPSEAASQDGSLFADDEENITSCVNGLLFEWLRRYKAKTGNDFFKINPDYFVNDCPGARGKGAFRAHPPEELEAVKCVINSDPEESIADLLVSNSEIPLLFVFLFDLVRFFSVSYGTSSMALFPKITQVNVERIYTINCLVRKSRFLWFSKMDRMESPRLELVADFLLQMEMRGNSTKFTKIDIMDCLLSRVYPNTNVSQVLCNNFLMHGKGHYVADVSSKMFFQFTIPQINLWLYTRDLSIIIHCFKSMMTDGPSVIPVKLVNNQLIDDNANKFLTLAFDIKGIEMLFYDDLKKSIVPLVKFTVESEKFEILNLPIEKRYSLMKCNCHLFYFNTNVGDWEPFIEKFAFNLEYITNPAGNKKPNAVATRITTQSTASRQNRTSDDDIWKDFVSDYQLKLTCNNILLLNITPNLCQLLQYFLPILKSNLLLPPHLNNPTHDTPPEATADTRVESLEDDIEMYNYRYINLTNHEYYAFIMDTSKPRRDAFSDVLKVVTTTTPKPLDSLVNQLHTEVSSTDYCIYLITRPPCHVVEHLSRELRCPEQVVEDDLITTASVLRTKSNLSNISNLSSAYNLPDLERTSGVAFNRNVLNNNGIVLSNIPLSKNCTVLLSVPLKDLNLFPGLKADTANNKNVVDRTASMQTNSDLQSNADSAVSGSMTSNRNSGSGASNLVTNRTSNSSTLNVPAAAESALGPQGDAITNTRQTNANLTIVNNNIICQVLTPHPSHKMLLFTSTVRIYNKSGMPLVMCFLDASFNRLYMLNPNKKTIPSNILYQNDMQNFKQYTSIDPNTPLDTTAPDVGLNENEENGHHVIIPNDYMLSVPENVFLSDDRVIFSFTPLQDAQKLNTRTYNTAFKTDYNKLVNTSGWCKFIDSSHHSGTRVRQCYCSDADKRSFLYFVVSVNNKRSSLPANVNISEIVIYPSLSVMNTVPVDLDIKMHSKDQNVQAAKGRNSASYYARDREEIVYRLKSKTILHIYSVPPNESLAVSLRLSKAEDVRPKPPKPSPRQILPENPFASEWCNRIDNIYGNTETKSVFSIMLDSSMLELELIRFPGALPLNNLCIQGHLSLVINAPWLFIDRTGLKLIPQHFNRIYTTGNLSFLYDNNNNNYKIVSLNNPGATSSRFSVPPRGHRSDRHSVSARHSAPHGLYTTGPGVGARPEDYIDDSEYDIKMPTIGGYVYTDIEIRAKKHCVCLITEKVYIPGLSHIASKITSAVPEYLFTNNLPEVVYLRKDSRSECMEIMPGCTHSISHLTQVNRAASPSNASRDEREFSENYIEIKVGMDISWSNVIYLSEEYSGETFMALARENSSKSQVFNITVVPKNGIKYISINAVEPPSPLALASQERNSIRGYLLHNNCSLIKLVMIRSFHKSDVRNGSCFTAKYGQVISFGWPNPFVHKSKLVQVLLWLDKNTVAPSKPLIFNFSTPSFRFRRIELTTPEYHTNYSITILAENRIDYYIIIINPHESPIPITSVFPPPAAPAAQLADAQPAKEPDKQDADDIDDNALLADTSKSLKNLKNEDLYVVEDDAGIKNFQLVLQVSQIGVSIVSQSLHEELFFVELGGIIGLFMRKEDHQRLELKVTDVQLDNQTDHEIGRTILVNRSKMETSDASFLQVYIDRPFSNCKDISIKKMFIALDDLQVEFNDLLFTMLYNYYKECLINLSEGEGERATYAFGARMDRGLGQIQARLDGKINIDTIEKWQRMEREKPTSSIDVNVKLPRSISIDYLYIEGFNLVVWCCFELEKLHMLGDLLRMGLRILSVSRNFELMGAPLSFQREYISINRTSVVSFYEQMKDKYLQACLSCIGSILGYSNLLNIPKIPLTVGKCTIELAAEAVDSVSTGLGFVLSKFTFDKDYIKRRSSGKDVTGIKDGIFSAGKTIGEGIFSLTNILTKPIEGAQKEGVGGFIKGLGKGLVGSIVKPIDKVGIAVSQVSRGIKANMSREEKLVAEPCRKSRMLWGEFSQIRTYSTVDAEIKQVLGATYSKYIMDCLVILRQVNNGKYIALLFYPSKIYLVDLIYNQGPSVGKSARTLSQEAVHALEAAHRRHNRRQGLVARRNRQVGRRSLSGAAPSSTRCRAPGPT